MENLAKAKLLEGKKLLGTFFSMGNPSAMECLGYTGMDFAITCLFACSLIGQWKDTGTHANVAMAAIIGIGCLLIFGPDGFMLPALSLTLILLIVFKRKVEKLDAERIL